MTYVRTRTKTGKACTVYNGTVIEENRIIANGTTEWVKVTREGKENECTCDRG